MPLTPFDAISGFGAGAGIGYNGQGVAPRHSSVVSYDPNGNMTSRRLKAATQPTA